MLQIPRPSFRVAAMTVVVVLCAPVHQIDAAGVDWGYSEKNGPEHWGKHFTICGVGKNQSPINIADERTLNISDLVTDQQTLASKPAGFLKIDFNYQTVPLKPINNGHAIEVEYDPGSTIHVHGRSRALQQFHFHSPSENQINGVTFPMEVHLVHEDEEENKTVVSVLFKEGKANPFIEKLWAHMPDQIGTQIVVPDEEINVKDMLPSDRRYYYFNGSLTTPPCSEGVAWLVLKEPVEISQEQIAAFRAAMGFANNRPVQPVNTRVVLTW